MKGTGIFRGRRRWFVGGFAAVGLTVLLVVCVLVATGTAKNLFSAKNNRADSVDEFEFRWHQASIVDPTEFSSWEPLSLEATDSKHQPHNVGYSMWDAANDSHRQIVDPDDIGDADHIAMLMTPVKRAVLLMAEVGYINEDLSFCNSGSIDELLDEDGENTPPKIVDADRFETLLRSSNPKAGCYGTIDAVGLRLLIFNDEPKYVTLQLDVSRRHHGLPSSVNESTFWVL